MAATYIDFEALNDSPRTLGIIGVLVDDDVTTTFEQVTLDERLYSARRARPHLRAGTLADVVAALVALDRPIVAWSSFDLGVVSESTIDPALKAAFAERYVNALLPARTWRTKVHPDFKIVREDTHAARHTLDQYAVLAGYEDAAQLRGAEPAKWIRHVLEQIASRQDYRRVTAKTKRDWHALLDYNRDDCDALRQVYEKATTELTQWRGYESTTYCVTDGAARPVCFRTGSTSARLAALLERYGARRWSFLTAWNPQSKRLPRDENDRRQTALIEHLTAAGYRCLRGEGRGVDASWPPDESVLALDIPIAAARRAGHAFGQLAIVAGERGRPARLVACS